jgi:hypothetical protein
MRSSTSASPRSPALPPPLRVPTAYRPLSPLPGFTTSSTSTLWSSLKALSSTRPVRAALLHLARFRSFSVLLTGQFRLTNAFDPEAEEYGHGAVGRPDNKVRPPLLFPASSSSLFSSCSPFQSILHPDLRNIPSQPAVQLIGNGPVTDERILQGLVSPCQLKQCVFYLSLSKYLRSLLSLQPFSPNLPQGRAFG